jgi:hypothetical protein
MSNRTIAVMLVTCVALTACDNAAPARRITAPGDGPVFSEASDPSSSPYGLSEFTLAGGPTAGESVDAAQAATGGRATGRFELSTPIGNRAAEQYSFTALSTQPPPTAKGEVDLHTLFTFGQEAHVHIDVDCLTIVGNQAWFSGPARRFVLGGVVQPPGLYLVFRVEDNGEGATAPPDRASPAFSGPPMGCMLMPPFPLIPTANGNVQVQSR